MSAPICISPQQHRFHQATEAASVVVGIPFFTYLALNRDLPTWARVLSGTWAAATLVVDGGLLLTWAARKRRRIGRKARR